MVFYQLKIEVLKLGQIMMTRENEDGHAFGKFAGKREVEGEGRWMRIRW